MTWWNRKPKDTKTGSPFSLLDWVVILIFMAGVASAIYTTTLRHP